MTEPTSTPPAEPAAEPAAKPDAEPLGDAGRRALDAERQARREAERQAREATERATALEAAEARRSVAAEKGLTDAQAALLTGTTRDEMAARADELLAAFRPDSDDPGLRRLPRERLRPGAVPDAAPREGLDKIADDIMGGL